VLGGQEILLLALEKAIEYGESILGEDDRYRRRKNGDKVQTDYENAAWVQLHRDSEGSDMGHFHEFLGSPHLQRLKVLLDTEKRRVSSWWRRKELNELQGDEAIRIVIK